MIFKLFIYINYLLYSFIMSILIKIRNIVYILRIFYWLAFKAVVKAYWRGSVHQYTFHYHSAQEIWAKELVALFRTKIYKCKDSKDVRKDKTIILSNHRSQADFWIHNICAEYSCNFLARYITCYKGWRWEWYSLFSVFSAIKQYGFSTAAAR